jgi:hypothetical protein
VLTAHAVEGVVQSPVKVFEAVVHPPEDKQMFEGRVTLHANAGTATVERKPMTAMSKPARTYFFNRLEPFRTFRTEY